MSPFTYLSLALISGGRLALRHLTAWPIPLTIALLGMILGGNFSSIMVQMIMPRLIADAFPGLVTTSIMTSAGLILFCLYELLIIFRETPFSAFISDDILLHLALLPGGISLLGHALNNPWYISSAADPRIGISLTEMAFMAAWAVVAVLANQRLFLWRFLAKGATNRVIFTLLFANYFILTLVVATLAAGDQPRQGPGIELFVMLGGIFTTLAFLSISARSKPGAG